MHTSFQRAKNQAFSLIEVSAAMGIFAFAIVVILGLMGAAMKGTRDSEERIQASNLATLIMARYQSGLESPGNFPWGSFPLPNNPSGSSSAANFDDGENGGLVDGFGNATADENEAAFKVKYLATKELIAGGPSEVVRCALRLEWPVQSKKPTNSFTATTAFVIP